MEKKIKVGNSEKYGKRFKKDFQYRKQTLAEEGFKITIVNGRKGFDLGIQVDEAIGKLRQSNPDTQYRIFQTDHKYEIYERPKLRK